MHTVLRLFDFVGPRSTSPEFLREGSSAHKLLVTSIAALLALGASALWGVVVGAHGHLALANVLTVPMLITASALASLPLALFVAKLTSSSLRATESASRVRVVGVRGLHGAAPARSARRNLPAIELARR